jgi:putative endonuclease
MDGRNPAKGSEPAHRVARPERQAAFALGLSAESRAAALLVAKGYRIAARRWRSPVGEIDLVARRGGLLVFVEVKARARIDDAAEAVTTRQRRRISAAAGAWLAAHPEDTACDMRFDVILVAPRCWPRHLVAAFDATP